MSELNLDARRIGGSDARYIMRGEWRELWAIKTQRQPYADLSDIFRVQLGRATESFNLDWYIKTSGAQVIERAQTLVHPAFAFATANIDMRVRRDGALRVVEAKHTNERNSPAKLVEEYFPQVQHYLAVTGDAVCDLSVIFGNKQHMIVPIEADAAYQAELMMLEDEFWSFVEADLEPQDRVPVAAKRSAEKANLTRYAAASLKGANEFAVAAVDWLDAKPAVARFAEAEAALKALVPKDASHVEGFGIKISCARNGSKRISAIGAEDDSEEEAA